MTTPPGTPQEKPQMAPRGLRGVALVDHVTGEIGTGRIPLWRALAPGKVERREPAPLTPDQLASLRLAGDRPLPPTLARWLAFDAQLLPEIIGGDPAAPRLEPRPLGELVGPPFGEMFVKSVGAFLTGAFYPLTTGSESTWALYVGQPDAIGEYPIFELRVDDTPMLALVAPGFGAWLAARMRVLDFEGTRDLFETPSYAAAMTEQARLNLAGHRFLEVNDWTVHGPDGAATTAELPPLVAPAGRKKDKKKRR